MVLVVLSGILFASEPNPPEHRGISGALSTIGLVDRFRDQGVVQGLSGEHLRIACQDVDEDLVLCLRNEDTELKWWVSYGELEQLGLSFEQAVTSIEVLAAEVQLEPRTVQEGSGRYWVANHSGGAAEALLFSPELFAVVGQSPAVAVPERGVLIAWNRGNRELDRIMAVGVRHLYEASDHPVSSKVMALVDSQWRVWLQAVEN